MAIAPVGRPVKNSYEMPPASRTSLVPSRWATWPSSCPRTPATSSSAPRGFSPGPRRRARFAVQAAGGKMREGMPFAASVLRFGGIEPDRRIEVGNRLVIRNLAAAGKAAAAGGKSIPRCAWAEEFADGDRSSPAAPLHTLTSPPRRAVPQVHARGSRGPPCNPGRASAPGRSRRSRDHTRPCGYKRRRD
jgi:hypothetical protein